MKFISKERYLIDTNVLVYSVNRKSSLYAPSRKIMEEGLKQKIHFVVAHQNLIEFIAVLTRAYKINPAEALRDAEAFASRFELIYPLHTTMKTYLNLAPKLGKTLYPFDLYLIATMQDNAVERIITGNVKDFKGAGLQEVLEVAAQNTNS